MLQLLGSEVNVTGLSWPRLRIFLQWGLSQICFGLPRPARRLNGFRQMMQLASSIFIFLRGLFIVLLGLVLAGRGLARSRRR